jgi:hypothetical protein
MVYMQKEPNTKLLALSTIVLVVASFLRVTATDIARCSLAASVNSSSALLFTTKPSWPGYISWDGLT